MLTPTEALAEAWASIDGKLDAFRRERDDRTLDWDSPGFTGHYEGYMEEAAEMIKRLRARGYDVTAIEEGK